MILNFIYKICNTRQKHECPICLEKKFIYIFPTCKNHFFCKLCILEWSEKYSLLNNKKINCPLCRN